MGSTLKEASLLTGVVSLLLYNVTVSSMTSADTAFILISFDFCDRNQTLIPPSTKSFNGKKSAAILRQRRLAACVTLTCLPEKEFSEHHEKVIYLGWLWPRAGNSKALNSKQVTSFFKWFNSHLKTELTGSLWQLLVSSVTYCLVSLHPQWDKYGLSIN